MEIDEDVADKDNMEHNDQQQSEEIYEYQKSPSNDLVLDEEQTQFVFEQLSLMTRKCVYPYEYMDSWSKFDRSVLPAKKHFDGMLTGQSISDIDYKHAKNVFVNFKVQDMRDYHNFYLLTDVLLLADVFETFRIRVYQIMILIQLVVILLQDYNGKRL